MRTQGSLIGIDNSTGQRIWQSNFVTSSIPDPLLIVQGEKVIVVSNNGIDLNVLRLADGSLLWRHSENIFSGQITLIATDENAIYVSRGRSGYIWAYDLENGELLWQSPQIGSSFVNITPKKDGVYLFDGLSLFILDSTTGEIKKSEIDKFKGENPKFTKNVVVQQDYDSLIARDLETGQPLWKFPRRVLNYLGYVTPIGRMVFVTNNCCDLYALNMETGRILWQTQFNSEIESQVTQIQNSGYVLLGDGSIRAFDLETGEFVGEILTSSNTATSYYQDKGLAASRDLLFATFGDNALFAFRTK